MSKLKPGVLGTFTGKTGRVVVVRYRGELVGRSEPSPSTKPPTKKQLDHQKKFGLMTSFFGKLTQAINMGYNRKSKVNGTNAAVRDHLETAVYGSYPDYQIDYSKVNVTKSGNGFHGGFRVSLESAAETTVTVNWNALDSDEQIPGTAGPTDLANVVFYNVNKRKGVFNFGEAERKARTASYQLPFQYVGDEFHAYLFFTSTDGKSTSTSDYLGSFILQECPLDHEFTKKSDKKQIN